MKLKQEEINDKVMGAEKEMSFTIDTDSSVIFEILRDKMYKDKIGSICREVASNSRDANREANSDKPVEITMHSPNRLLTLSHPSISFKDYGWGITPSRMEDIYLKYGASNKRSDNIQTGGFGLGAKTPFAYNDTFTVITVCDVEGKRMKYKYTAMLDKSQKGKMVCFESKEVDEPTGTEVIVPIKNLDDRWKFEKESLKYTKTWGDEIIYKGFEYHNQIDFEVAHEEDNFVIYKTDEHRYGNTMELLIDGIPYPLDTSIVNAKDTVGRVDGYYLTILKFNTGELTISANRESVQYDEDTISLIEERVQEVHTALDTLTHNYLQDCESYLEACQFTYYVNRKSSNQANPSATVGAILAHSKSTNIRLKKADWKGWSTMDRFVFAHHEVYYVALDANDRNYYEASRTFHLNERNCDLPIYYGDVRKNARRNANLWEEGHEAFFLIKPIDSEDKQGIEEFMSFIYSFDFNFGVYSELEPVKKEASVAGVYQKKSFVTLNVRRIDSYGFQDKDVIRLDRKDHDCEHLDLSNTVYCAVDSLSDAQYLHSTKKDLKFLAKRGYNAFIIRQQDYNNWFVNTKIKFYEDVLEEERQKVIDEKVDLVKASLIRDVLNDVFSYNFNKYEDVLQELLPQSCKDLPSKGGNLSNDEINLVKKYVKFDFDGLRKKLNPIFAKYPLLNVLLNASSYRFNSDNPSEEIAMYIKQVDFYNENK